MVSLAVVKNSSATTKGSQGASRMTRSGGLVGVVGNASTPELRSQYVFAVAGAASQGREPVELSARWIALNGIAAEATWQALCEKSTARIWAVGGNRG